MLPEVKAEPGKLGESRTLDLECGGGGEGGALLLKRRENR